MRKDDDDTLRNFVACNKVASNLHDTVLLATVAHYKVA